MKITFVSAVHGRKYFWKHFAKGVENLEIAFQNKGYDTDKVAACTTEEECEYFLKHGFTTIWCGNKYLGEKWNEAIYYSWSEGADYIMMIGSDDIISPDIVEEYDPLLKQRHDIFGLKKMMVLDYERDKVKEFTGHKPTYRLSIGAGKMISSNALRRVAGRPAERVLYRGLDTSIIVNLRKHGFEDKIIDTKEYLILDVKNEENLNNFTSLQGVEYPADYNKLKSIFKIKLK